MKKLGVLLMVVVLVMMAAMPVWAAMPDFDECDSVNDTATVEYGDHFIANNSACADCLAGGYTDISAIHLDADGLPANQPFYITYTVNSPSKVNVSFYTYTKFFTSQFKWLEGGYSLGWDYNDKYLGEIAEGQDYPLDKINLLYYAANSNTGADKFNNLYTKIDGKSYKYNGGAYKFEETDSIPADAYTGGFGIEYTTDGSKYQMADVSIERATRIKNGWDALTYAANLPDGVKKVRLVRIPVADAGWEALVTKVAFNYKAGTNTDNGNTADNSGAAVKDNANSSDNSQPASTANDAGSTKSPETGDAGTAVFAATALMSAAAFFTARRIRK